MYLNRNNHVFSERAKVMVFALCFLSQRAIALQDTSLRGAQMNGEVEQVTRKLQEESLFDCRVDSPVFPEGEVGQVSLQEILDNINLTAASFTDFLCSSGKLTGTIPTAFGNLVALTSL